MKKVGIIFGGKSAEHEISLLSAKNVYDAIDKEKFNPTLIKIEKSGKWQMNEIFNFDVIFPILHGPFGEDGTIQGLLKLADIPFVGPDVLGSAVGMDKDVMKRLLRDAGIPIGKFLTIKSYETMPSFAEVQSAIGSGENKNIFFIKPANMGSSVGINKVKNQDELSAALKDAFQYDTKVIIEEFIPGREIECAVLGNEEPAASIPGEIIPSHDFYSYDAKYIDDNGAALEIPAKLDNDTIKRIQELAIKVFKTLNCEGLSRVDLFLKPNGELIVNEINTMPGFTKISMYPKMWEKSGISYTDLITRLIELAISRFERDQKLKTTVV
ncbi:MAG: D-alanine--D-alanine ligase [Treponema sp.]|nr:D-alanine--D-alanine ligase [Treponema sp.]